MLNQRTDPRFQKLKRLIESGQLGRINRIQWTVTDWFRTEAYYASGAWRATWKGEGGGVLLNQCPHQLDLWQWLFGMPGGNLCPMRSGPLSRYRSGGCGHRPPALRERNYRGLHIHYRGSARGQSIGDCGRARAGRFWKGIPFAGPAMKPSHRFFPRNALRGFGKVPTWRWKFRLRERGSQHMGVFKNFSDAIRGEADLLFPAADGIHSVELGQCHSLLRSQPPAHRPAPRFSGLRRYGSRS